MAFDNIGINEFRISSSGSSDNITNFVELFGPVGQSTDGLHLVVLSGEFAPGAVDFSFDLTGGSFDDDGVFLLAQTGTEAATDTGDLTFDFDLFGSPTNFLLVEGWTGDDDTDYDADNDGTLDSTPWTTLVDSFSLTDGDETTDATYGAVTLGPDGSFTPAAGARLPDGDGDFSLIGFSDVADSTPGELNEPSEFLDVRINEFRVSSSGSSDNITNFVELIGTPEQALDGLHLVVLSGEFAPGEADFIFDLTGGSFDDDGVFLLAQTGSEANIDSGDIQADFDFFGSPSNFMLVEGWTGNDDTDYDADNDGTLDSTPWTTLIDSFSLTDGDETTDAAYGAVTLGPDGSFTPAAGARLPDGSGDFSLIGFSDVADSTPGEVNDPPEPIDHSAVRINELRISSSGSSDNTSNFVELYGTPGQSLDGLHLAVLSGEFAPGAVDFLFDLTGGSFDDNGFFLLAQTGSAADIDSGDIQADFDFFGSPSNFLLVEGWTGSEDTDYDTDNDGTLDSTPWTTLIDSVSLVDGDETTDATYSATVFGPDGSFTPAALARETDGTGAFQLVSFGTPDLDTPGESNEGDPVDEITLISAIQGAGSDSPLDGETVKVEAIVTLLAPALNGFFVQEQVADYDDDTLTSEGVFVYTGGAYLDAVAVGDLVQVSATVGAYSGSTQLTGVSDVSVVSSGNALPKAQVISLPWHPNADPDARFEALEGMRVTLKADGDSNLVVTDTYTRFGEVGLTTDQMLVQPTQVYDHDSADAAELLVLNSQNILHVEDAQNDALSSAPRAGDGVVGNTVSGVLHESFGDYKIETDGPIQFDPSINPFPRETEAPDVGGDFQVASFNVLNLFTTLDDGSQTANGNDPRGAETAEDLANQTAKLVTALLALEAEIIGLMEIENDFEAGAAGNALEYLVDEMNAELGETAWAWVDPGTKHVGGDAIAQAFIYDTRAISLVGDAAILDSEEFTSPYTPGDPKNRPAIAQTFEHDATGETVTLAVNHFKSKGSTTGAVVDGENDDNPMEGSAALTRVAASEELASWLATDPTSSGGAPVMVIGDLNAYASERAIDALADAGYLDLLFGQSFTYAFDGRFGSLDYAMAGFDLLPAITGAEAWHINSLESYSIQYDGGDFDSFGDLSQFASSDHDPVLVGLDLDTATVLAQGTAVADSMVDVAGDDFFLALEGNDTIVLTEGNATVLGGDGYDRLSLSGHTGPALIDIYDRAGIGEVDGDLFLFNEVERIEGTQANDRFLLADAVGFVHGRGGNDRFFRMDPDEGGFARINGGAGKDWVSYSDVQQGIEASLAANRGGVNNSDVYKNIERLEGSTFDDGLEGNDRANILKGLAGDDILQGNGGNDKIRGGAGYDIAVFTFDQADYTVESQGAKTVVTYIGLDANGDGQDVLADIELLRFADGDLDLLL